MWTFLIWKILTWIVGNLFFIFVWCFEIFQNRVEFFLQNSEYQIWQQIIFKREEESLASSLLNIICRQNWYQSKSDYMDRALVCLSFLWWHFFWGLKKKYLTHILGLIHAGTPLPKENICNSFLPLSILLSIYSFGSGVKVSLVLLHELLYWLSCLTY